MTCITINKYIYIYVCVWPDPPWGLLQVTYVPHLIDLGTELQALMHVHTYQLPTYSSMVDCAVQADVLCILGCYYM